MEMNQKGRPDCCAGPFAPDCFPLGMAYVPLQESLAMYENLEKAYCSGTIFPELDKPFTGRRCVR